MTFFVKLTFHLCFLIFYRDKSVKAFKIIHCFVLVKKGTVVLFLLTWFSTWLGVEFLRSFGIFSSCFSVVSLLAPRLQLFSARFLPRSFTPHLLKLRARGSSITEHVYPLFDLWQNFTLTVRSLLFKNGSVPVLQEACEYPDVDGYQVHSCLNTVFTLDGVQTSKNTSDQRGRSFLNLRNFSGHQPETEMIWTDVWSKKQLSDRTSFSAALSHKGKPSQLLQRCSAGSSRVPPTPTRAAPEQRSVASMRQLFSFKSFQTGFYFNNKTPHKPLHGN